MKDVPVRLVVGLLVLQGLLVSLYFALERDAVKNPEKWTYVTTQWSEKMDARVETFEVEHSDGSTTTVDPSGRVLLHFWATWCPACIEEIPLLLREAEARDIEVIAIAVNEDWPSLERFFDGKIPRAVVRSPGDSLSRQLSVENLPQTIVVEAGRASQRLVGPRDWRNEFDRLQID